MARIRTGDVKIEGLRQLNKSLKELGPEFPKEMRKVNKEVAGGVAEHAIRNAHSLGGVAAHVVPSIKASAGVNSAAVALGGLAHPAAGGAEFGGQRRPTTQQFKPWRGAGSNAGYFLYPAIREDADEIYNDYLEALDDLVHRAGLDKKVSL
jgi:hypothetical protein